MEPFPKRPRAEPFDAPGLNPGFQPPPRQPQDRGGLQLGVSAAGGGIGGEPECRYFNSPEGCPYGSACRFRHLPAGPIPYGRDVGQQIFSSSGKPKPCMKIFSTSGCPFGESCHFLHYVPGGLGSLGLAPVVSLSAASASATQKKASIPVGDPSVTVNGYKTKLCNQFNTFEGCRFGDRCHFAHGESDLRSPNNMPLGNKRPMPNEVMGTPPSGHSSGGHSNFPNPTGYPAPPGSYFSSQGYVDPNQPGVAVNTTGPVSYPGHPGSENVPVY